MKRQSEADKRARFHAQKRKLKARRHRLEAERADGLRYEAERGLRSHAGYCLEERILPAEAHARLCQEARRGSR
jgi:hypothetical protein